MSIDRTQYQRTAGHPPAGVPLRSGYNPDATVTQNVPGFGGDKPLRSINEEDYQALRKIADQYPLPPGGVSALIKARYEKD